MPEKAFRTLRNISILYAATFAFLVGSLTLILLQKGMTLAQVGLYYTLYSIGVLLFQIPTGAFADAYGRKKAIAAAFLFQIIFGIGFVLIPNGLVFVGFALVVAFADSMMSGAAEAYAVEILPQKQQQDYTHKLLASSKTWGFSVFLFGAIIGGYLTTVSPVYPVILCLIFGIIGLGYSLTLKETETKQKFDKAEREILSKSGKAFDLVFQNQELLTICSLTFLLGLSAVGLFIYWQPVLSKLLDWNATATGAFFSVISIAIIIGSKTSSWLKPKTSVAFLVIVGFGITLLIASWIPIPLAVALLILAWEFLFGFYLPIESTVVSNNSPPALRATVLSVKGMFYQAGRVIFGLFIFFSESLWSNEPRIVWTVGASILLIGVGVVFIEIYRKRTRGSKRSLH
ncbi:MFS transporter [Candidatus Micrarchaeota archaeon]|nr:MFS transporter [Candidatus Micrarchaeota archaeon]